MVKKIFLFLFLFASLPAIGQVGRSFWFVVPGLMHDHGVNPIMFRITAMDKAAKVTVSMPANGTFKSQTINVAANQQVNFVLNTVVSENIPAAQVNNKGYLISSDQDISVYYDVADQYNPDKFVLKGQSALGTRFFIPSQNDFPIAPEHKIASEKVDIVATEDNTEVSFTPPVPVVGHAKNVPVTIKLNRGQTYCIENRDQSAKSSMAGMLVTSTKDIAITISDDSVLDYWPHDLIGDQLIPVSMLGMEYIAMRTNNDKGSKHKVYLLGTQDGTSVMIGNNPANVHYLNAGEQKMFDVTGSALYIKASKPIYAYQLTGVWNNNGNEFGSALLPSIVCTGSNRVSFTRTQTARFFIQLLTQRKNRNGFKLTDAAGSNQTNLLGTINWTEVPGTANGDATWYSAIILLNASTGKPYTITNSLGLFHLSVLDENGGSLSYGYFSSYSALRISIPSKVCAGDVVTLTAEGDLNDVKWYSDKTGNTILGTSNTLDVTESAEYRVVSTSQFGECTITATADVVFQKPIVDLGDDRAVCPGETVKLEVSPDEGTIQWHNNSTSHIFTQLVEANKSYKASVTITNSMGCSNTDEVEISALPAPVLNIGFKEQVCRGGVLSEIPGFERYQWVDGNQAPNPADNKNTYEPTHSGAYHLTVWNFNGCSTSQSINVVVNELPALTLNDVIACDQSAHIFTAPSGMSKYLWHDGTTSSKLQMDKPGDLSLEITDGKGCVNQATANFSWYGKTVFTKVDDFSVCEGSDHTIVSDASLTNFSWFFDDGVTVTDLANTSNQFSVVNAKRGGSGTFIIKAHDANGCEVEDRVVMTVLEKSPLDLGAKRDICQGSSAQLVGDVGFVHYQWSLGATNLSNNRVVDVSSTGVYTLIATAPNGCKSVSDVAVAVHELPKLVMSDVNTQCQGTSFTIGVKSFETVNGSSSLSYQWQALVNGAWQTLAGAGFDTAPIVVPDASKKYRLTVYDDLGCSDTKEIQPQYFKPLVVDLQQEVSFCDNTSYVLHSPLKQGVDVIDFQWFRDSKGSLEHGEVNESWSVQLPGTYVLAVTDLNNCPAQASMTLSALASPVFTIGSDREICNGDQTTISIDGGFTFTKYQWNNDPADNKAYKNVDQAGTYELKVWNKTGCAASQSVNVVVNALPDVALVDAITCSKGSHTFHLPSGLGNYLWHDGSTQPSLTMTAPGDVAVTVTDSKGCQNSASAKFEWHKVTAFEKAGDIRLCEGSDHVIRADANLKKFQWLLERGGVTTDLNNSTSEWPLTNVQMTDNGSVFVIKAEDVNGCAIEDRASLVVDVKKFLSLGADRYICRGDTIQLEGNHGFELYNWTSSNGEMSHESYVLVAEAGIYKLEATHFNGCVSTDEVKVDVYNRPSLTMSAIKDQCHGTSFTLSVDHFTPVNGPIEQYEWSYKAIDGWKVMKGEKSSFLDVSGNDVGPLYRVVAYDNLGCFAIGEQQPKHHEVFEVKLIDQIQTCDNASFTLTSPYTPGVDVKSYQWFKGTVGSVVSGLPDSDWSVGVQPNHEQFGTYVLSVVDNNGCPSQGSTELVPYEALLLDLGSDRAFCEGSQVRIKDEKGTLFERYMWNGDVADNRPYKDVNQSGTHTLKVWDMNGCSDERSVAITKNSLPSLSLSDVVACANTQHTFMAPSGMKNYQWQDGSTADSYSLSVPGEVQLTITDNNGCSNNDVARFDWFDVVDFKRISDVVLCEGAPLYVESDNKLHDFQWSFNGADLNHSDAQYSLPQVLKGGDGKFTIQALDANNCPVYDEFDLSVLHKAPLTLTPDRHICEGATVELNGSQGFMSYDWQCEGVHLSTKPVVEVSKTGLYRLLATHANSCQSEATVHVQVHELPTLTMADLPKACEGSAFTLSMKSFVTKNGDVNPLYQWCYNDGGHWVDMPGKESVVVSQVNRRYRLTVSDDLRCSDSKELQPAYFDPFVLTLPDEQTFCENSHLLLESPAVVGVDVSGYQWFKDVYGSSVHGATNQAWQVNAPGRYVLAVVDLNGCKAEAATELKSLEKPLLSLGADRAICHGDVLNLEVGDANQFVKYMWNDDANDNLPQKRITTEGVYRLTVWNKNSCQASDEVFVKVNSLPVVDLGPDVWSCTGLTTTLDAKAGFQKYQWSNGATTQKVEVFKGDYSVLVTDANGCVGGDMVNVAWYDVPAVDLGDDEYVCPLAEPVLDAGAGFVSYKWHDGSTSSTIKAVVGELHQVFVTDQNGCVGMDSKYVLPLSIPEMGLDPVHTVCDNAGLVLDAGAGYNYYLWSDGSTDQIITPKTPGVYTVEVSDGCFIMNDTVQVNFMPSPVVAGVDSTYFKQLTIQVTGGTLPYEYQLNFGRWQDDPTFTNLENGHHQFVVRDVNGCSVEYEVDYTSFIEITIPPFITPNGDGYNDTWVIPGIERTPQSEIRIYDRFGKLLANYKATDPAWDGTYQGKPLPTDSYWYVLEIKPGNRIIKGYLTLKR